MHLTADMILLTYKKDEFPQTFKKYFKRMADLIAYVESRKIEKIKVECVFDTLDHIFNHYIELKIQVLKEEISLWEKRLKDDPNDIPYLSYIRTTLKVYIVV